MNVKKLVHFSLKSMNVVFLMIFCIYILEKLFNIVIIGEKMGIILIETAIFSYILLNLAPLSREMTEKSLKIFSLCYYLSILITLLTDIRFIFIPILIVVFCLYSLRKILPGISSIFPIILLSLMVSFIDFIPLFSMLILLIYFLSFNVDVLKSKNAILPIILLTVLSASFSLPLRNMFSFEISLSMTFLMISLFLPKEFYTYRKFFIFFDLSFLIALISILFAIKTENFESAILQITLLYFVLYSLSLFKISRSVGMIRGNPEKVFLMIEIAILIQAILLVFLLGGYPLFSVLITEVVTLGIFFVKVHDILKIYRENIEG